MDFPNITLDPSTYQPPVPVSTLDPSQVTPDYAKLGAMQIQRGTPGNGPPNLLAKWAINVGRGPVLPTPQVGASVIAAAAQHQVPGTPSNIVSHVDGSGLPPGMHSTAAMKQADEDDDEDTAPVAPKAKAPAADEPDNPPLQQVMEKTMNPGAGIDEQYKKDVVDYLENHHGIDIHAIADQAADDMGMPNSGIKGMSKENKAMLLLHFGLAQMAAASKPGANFFGSLAAGGEGGLAAYDQLKKQRADAMATATQQAIQQNTLDTGLNTAARQNATDLAAARQTQLSNLQKAAELQNQALSGEEDKRRNDLLYQERMAKIGALQYASPAEIGRRVRARMVAMSNPLSEESKHPRTYDQVLAEETANAQNRLYGAGIPPAGGYGGGVTAGGQNGMTPAGYDADGKPLYRDAAGKVYREKGE
jgi:hypothetical protein